MEPPGDGDASPVDGVDSSTKRLQTTRLGARTDLRWCLWAPRGPPPIAPRGAALRPHRSVADPYLASDCRFPNLFPCCLASLEYISPAMPPIANLDNFPESPYAEQLRTEPFPQRFPPPLEVSYLV
jgi:hypothetical protein